MRCIRTTFAPCVAALLFGATTLAGAQRGAVVAHVLNAADGLAVAGADVTIVNTQLHARTDSLGTATLTGIPSGDVSIEARRVGFGISMAKVKAPAGADTIEVVLLLRGTTQTLPVVTVKDSAVSPTLSEFDSRRRNHIGGFYVDQSVIAKWEGSRIAELASAKFPGIRAEVTPDQKIYFYNTRGGNGSILRFSNCKVEVFLDRVRLADGDANLVPLSALAGIEFYPPGFVPVQYRVQTPAESKTPGGSACGVLLLWRRPAGV
jgi:hypothetical protein